VDAVRPGAGIIEIHNFAATGSLPTGFTELNNLSLPGLGQFLVAEASSQPIIRELEVLPAGQEKWYRFSTLGDGQLGDSVELTTAADAAKTIALTGNANTLLRIPGFSFLTPLVNATPGLSLQLGGDAIAAIYEIDASSLLAYALEPERIDHAVFRLNYSGLSETPHCMSRFSRSRMAQSPGPIPLQSHWAADIVLPGSPSPIQVDLKNVIREVLRAGYSRFALRVTSQSITAPVAITLSSFTNGTSFTVDILARDGVAGEIYDGNGIRVRKAGSYMDLSGLRRGILPARVRALSHDASRRDLQTSNICAETWRGVGVPRGTATCFAETTATITLSAARTWTSLWAATAWTCSRRRPLRYRTVKVVNRNPSCRCRKTWSSTAACRLRIRLSASPIQDCSRQLPLH
jgi:hypothetical protein